MTEAVRILTPTSHALPNLWTYSFRPCARSDVPIPSQLRRSPSSLLAVRVNDGKDSRDPDRGQRLKAASRPGDRFKISRPEIYLRQDRLWKEKRSQNMFDAVAAGLTCFYKYRGGVRGEKF